MSCQKARKLATLLIRPIPLELQVAEKLHACTRVYCKPEPILIMRSQDSCYFAAVTV